MKGLSGLLLLAVSCGATATDYYVSSANGRDRNSGMSEDNAWKSINKVNETGLEAGDRVSFAAGEHFRGGLKLRDIEATAEAPVIVGSYGSGRAVIDGSGYQAAVHITNSSHVEVRDLEITAGPAGRWKEKAEKMRVGVLVGIPQAGAYENITLDNLVIHDIFFEAPGATRSLEETRSANGTQSYGYGIRVLNWTGKSTLKGLTISNVSIARVSHTGVKISGGDNLGVSEIRLLKNRVTDVGGPGLQMSRVTDVLVRGNIVNGSGSVADSRNWGRGSGMWTWKSSDVLVEKNAFLNANGPGDSAGVHIDFGCRNVVIQYNLSANNAGGFCEILGDNYNNAYRYNVSINDGFRVKGENGAFQEGKTFWLSGYRGKKLRNGPFNTYFYNNTIYTNKELVAKFAVDQAAEGILVANNIFYIEGSTQAVLGDQYKPQEQSDAQARNVFFESNLFLRENTWPADVLIQPGASMFGDPGFDLGDVSGLKSFIPTNTALVEDMGVRIRPLQGDDVGLKVGLEVAEDILGNPISRAPDLGAIEVSR